MLTENLVGWLATMGASSSSTRPGLWILLKLAGVSPHLHPPCNRWLRLYEPSETPSCSRPSTPSTAPPQAASWRRCSQRWQPSLARTSCWEVSLGIATTRWQTGGPPSSPAPPIGALTTPPTQSSPSLTSTSCPPSTRCNLLFSDRCLARVCRTGASQPFVTSTLVCLDSQPASALYFEPRKKGKNGLKRRRAKRGGTFLAWIACGGGGEGEGLSAEKCIWTDQRYPMQCQPPFSKYRKMVGRFNPPFHTNLTLDVYSFDSYMASIMVAGSVKSDFPLVSLLFYPTP